MQLANPNTILDHMTLDDKFNLLRKILPEEKNQNSRPTILVIMDEDNCIRKPAN